MEVNRVEPIKRLIEKATGLGVPTHEEALGMVRRVRPSRMNFRDDGYIPNNPKLPLLYYRKAISFDRNHDPAATLECIFNAHEWGEAWRNGIYDFVHYHSMIHEVLGVARGTATLRLGGNKGKTVKVAAGDVVVIPAGVGHECLGLAPHSWLSAPIRQLARTTNAAEAFKSAKRPLHRSVRWPRRNRARSMAPTGQAVR
jgi:uncharacterized protein YjlB